MNTSSVPEVIARLNQRETSAYTTHKVVFYPRDTDLVPFPVLVYIGTESSFGFLGPSPLPDIALQIVQSSGKSGPNSDYVLKLASIMREIAPGVHDEHLFTLEERVIDLLKNESTSTTRDKILIQKK